MLFRSISDGRPKVLVLTRDRCCELRVTTAATKPERTRLPTSVLAVGTTFVGAMFYQTVSDKVPNRGMDIGL